MIEKHSMMNHQERRSFLANKLRNISVNTLIRLEIEAWCLALTRPWPGTVGFFIRNVTLSLLLKKKKGMMWVQPGVQFVHCERLQVGANCGINSGTYINALGGITFGDYVLIGSNVTISSGKHPIEGELPPVYVRQSEPLPIKIEDDVWIGAGAVIMPGVTLRKGTVVGANAVVTKDTEEYAVVVGAPARKVRSRRESSALSTRAVALK